MRGAKNKSTWKYFPYTPDDLKKHLESQFVKGMTWENYGRGGWVIDHRRPCCMFDHNDSDQIKQCWALENLQPLWEKDNLQKGARLDWEKPTEIKPNPTNPHSK